MNVPTETEREQAELLTTAWETSGEGYGHLDDLIARALADQRAKYQAQQDDEVAARRFLARHYWAMASAENVGDWQAYIRVCAQAQEDGTAWLDHPALDDLRAALAARPSADTETLRRVRELARALDVDASDMRATAQDSGSEVDEQVSETYAETAKRLRAVLGGTR